MENKLPGKSSLILRVVETSIDKRERRVREVRHLTQQLIHNDTRSHSWLHSAEDLPLASLHSLSLSPPPSHPH